MIRWKLKRKNRFADSAQEETSTELLGPMGTKALKGQYLRNVGVLLPIADISSLVSITFDLNHVIPQNDLVTFRSLDLEITSGQHFNLSICIGKTVNPNTGLTYWTSEGCRPVLDYVHQEMPINRVRGYGPYFSGRVKCSCDWQSEPPSHPAVSGLLPKKVIERQSSDSIDSTETETDTEAVGLVLAIIVLVMSTTMAFTFTYLLFGELNKCS